MDDLKECPFCGGKDIRFMGYPGMYQNSHCECKDCHTIGPAVFVDDGKAATEAWNRRAVPQASAHTIEDDFQHFLSYSNLSFEPEEVKEKLLKAYEANWVAGPQANAEQDAQDAARYRWLKSKARIDERDGGYHKAYCLPHIEKESGTIGKPLYHADFDSAVDAAMREEE